MHKTMQIILLLSIIFVAFVIFSHDYSAHDHLEFLHNLLRDDASIKEIPLLFALNGIISPNVVRSDTNINLIKNVCHWVHDKLGNAYHWPTLEVLPLVINIEQDSLWDPVSSGLSASADIIARARGFYPLSCCVVLSSDHVIQNNWFHHISAIFSSAVASGYFNIRNTEKDRSFFHVANRQLAILNNALEMQKLLEALINVLNKYILLSSSKM